MPKKIAIMVMAAGKSSRMKTPKQLLPFHNGTLLSHALMIASKSTTSKVYAVLGANEKIIREAHEKLPVNWIINKNWELGLGNSIGVGIGEILNTENDLDGVLIILADQPYLDADYLGLMLQKFETNEKTIVATQYARGFGVPVLFDKMHFDDLVKLEGESGAKEYLKKLTPNIMAVKPNGKEKDIDTPEAYAEALKLIKQNNTHEN